MQEIKFACIGVSPQQCCCLRLNMATTHEELESFVTIVECGTFRSAADKLIKSQSSISYAVKSLEDELGVSLFDRNFYRPRLTPEGEIVYQKAILILSLSKDLKSISKNHSPLCPIQQYQFYHSSLKNFPRNAQTKSYYSRYPNN